MLFVLGNQTQCCNGLQVCFKLRSIYEWSGCSQSTFFSVSSDWSTSENVYTMDETETFVVYLKLEETDAIVPESIFCLKHLEHLLIVNMNFLDGSKTFCIFLWIDDTNQVFLRCSPRHFGKFTTTCRSYYLQYIHYSHDWSTGISH